MQGGRVDSQFGDGKFDVLRQWVERIRGLGLPAGIPDWGMDLSMGKKFLPSGVWWMITFPGLMIMLLALGFTMLGEGLAEILNPRLLER